MNIITITGRFVKDLELRKSAKGTMYIQNTLAVARTKEITDFIPVVITGKTAEFIAANSMKGGRVILEGVLQSNTYEKDGKKNTSYNVLVNRAEPIDWRVEKKSGESNSDDELPFEV